MSKKLINLNDFAVTIAKEEGLKDNISIAQVKEVMRLVFRKLATMSLFEIANVLTRYK